MRDLPAVLWLTAAAAVVVLHPLVPAPRWLVVHLLLLGAASHSILVWSRHFADALLHVPNPPSARRRQSARLALLNIGTLLVVAGVVTPWWPATAAGASAVAAAAIWHGSVLLRQLRSALAARFGPTVRYYVAAAAMLPVGALIGAVVARGVAEPAHQRLVAAHLAVNVLGWLGLTVLGTLVTLWPTMLRTRIAPGAERAAARALPVLLAAVVLTAAMAAAGSLVGAASGCVLYLVGAGMLAVPFASTARRKPPSSFATWSVLAGFVWFVGTVAFLSAALFTASSWAQAYERVTALTPALAVGFAAQVLLGALSFLVPVVLRGGPRVVRESTAVLDRAGPARVVLVNAGLLISLPPVPGAVRTLGTALVTLTLAAFVPLVLLAVRAAHAARTDPAAEPGPGQAAGPSAGSAATRGPTPPPRGRSTAMALAGLAVVLLATAAGVAMDQESGTLARADAAVSAGVAATGETTEVAVRADHMRFTPSRIEVPAGNRLVITLHNADPTTVHDLVLENGADTGRLAPGETRRIDAGVVGSDLDGWCSVAGHRQLGMVLTVVAVGGTPGHGGTSGHEASAPPSGGDAPAPDFMATPPPAFTAQPAELPPAPTGRVHRHTFTVEDVVREVAPGVTQTLWTYNGTAPGPVLRGKVGDTFEVTLVNHGSMGHSIDFHAGALAPDVPMRTIPPGASLVYRFTATKAGIWMYHCSSMPMSAHIANGLFGAVVIDPPDLPPVAKEYLLVQSELYLGAQGGSVDVDKLDAERPDAVVFNGYANQYDHRPLTARAGERVRIWVLDAGPNRPSAFHVVGGQFDTVYAEGSYLLEPSTGGSQVLSLAAASGGFVELAFPEPGSYPFITHIMVDAERGAHGIVRVSR